MRIAFITDLHFGRQTIDVEAALLEDLRAQKPDLILIGGDVTQRGFKSQYLECQKFLNALPAPWLAVIGNHDVPAWNFFQRLTDPYGPYRKYITPELNPHWANHHVAILGLNSARRWLRDGAWEQGAIDDEQIELAKVFFKHHTDKTRILMVHHPLTHPPLRQTKLLVHNYQRALEGFAAAGVDIICSGHLHRNSVWDGKALVPNRARPLWLLHGGTVMCDRLRGECNNYWMIEIGAAEPQFTLRNFAEQKFN